MQDTKFFMFFIVLESFHPLTGQQYNLTGSSTFAMLGQAFTWKCDMFLPQGQSGYGVSFYRDNYLCLTVGYRQGSCYHQSSCPEYNHQCLTTTQYSLTIPREKLTMEEQGRSWKCTYASSTKYTSPTIKLKIAIDVQNVSIFPSANPMTIIEGRQKQFRCVVNEDAVPAPNITWNLGSDLTSLSGVYSSYINVTVYRGNNTRTIVCSATNNNKQPIIASTELIIEYPPTVIKLSKHYIIEGRELIVKCQAKLGNPNITTFFWTKVDQPDFQQNRSTLQLPNIERSRSGIYICTAENNYSNGEKGTHSQLMDVIVFYPPTVNAMSQEDIIEGRNLSVNCTATPGNPTITTYFWTKEGSTTFRQNGSTLLIPNIQKTSSSTYVCTAQNVYNDGGSGNHSQPLVVNVLYPPTVNTMLKQNIIEGDNLSVSCNFTPGNPSDTTFHWTKFNNSGLRQNKQILLLPYIQRNSSGTYICTAENNLGNGEKGIHNHTMVVNVLYHPNIEKKSPHFVNESRRVEVTRHISSNPLSTALWYLNTVLVLEEKSVEIATFIIENATCMDTKNFTLVARNGVGNDTALVELIVNCKPQPYAKNITIGIADTTGIDFSTTIIAYPEPDFQLENENGTMNNRMTGSISRNAVNNFTIHLNQTVVEQRDFGSYQLKVTNLFGEARIQINVLPQRKPNKPRNIEANCEETAAKVQWISSFDGGDTQTFSIFAIQDLHEARCSNNLTDKGEDKIHSNYIQDLQPSALYVIYVSAQNRHGKSSSENITCRTLDKDTDNYLGLIAGGAVAGGITLAVIVVVIVILLRRVMHIDKHAGTAQRLKNEVDNKDNEDADVDGLKENSLYVSAGPRDDEKTEVAVYAAVAKKLPHNDNNSNLYADVKKSGRRDTNKGTMSSEVKPKKGLFKKDEKGKNKKGKKLKNRPREADVYENSEDIAMSTNVDNVYSNAAQKGQNKQKERGYKNKDGLLYVEVNFDGKQGQDNPIIHGEDEKTDYAIVEFPMPSALHKASGSEEL